MGHVAENIKRLRERIDEAAIKAGREPATVQLMAVTKTQPAQLVNEAIVAGVTLLGENRAQELCERYESYDLHPGVDIHFIGHLQTNKVKMLLGKVSTVQSVGSLRLAAELSKQGEKLGVSTDLLLEINIGGEESKAGVAPADAPELVRQIAQLPFVRLRGLMAIPPIWNENAGGERFFAQMQEMLVDIRAKNIDNVNMDILSMGMTDDFDIAVKHGSTLVRLGTAIFGARNYGQH